MQFNFSRKSRGKKGFSMIETLLAIFILNVAVSGVFLLIKQVSNSAFVSQTRLTALYLAQEGVEIIRNIRDTNWLHFENGKEFLIHCNNGCEADYKTATVEGSPAPRAYTDAYLNIDANKFYSYSAGEPTRFKREIIIEEKTDVGLEANFLEVKVIVRWAVKGVDYNVEIINNLYEWYFN